MKASYLKGHGGPEVVQYGELPEPQPGPGEVRVRLHSAALNHLDIWVREGLPGLKLQYPHVLGGDGAGVVDAVGPGAKPWKGGEEVIVHPGLSCGRCPHCLGGWESLCKDYRILGEHLCGTHAEYVVVPAGNLFAKPEKMSFEEAAAMPLVFTTAWQMLVRRAQVRPGETVVIHAAGSGVGSAGVQIAKLLGATVVATAGSEEKLALARQLGADHTLNYSQPDWTKTLKSLAPEGADVIFDHLGKDFWGANLKAIKSGGRITVCGATTGPDALTSLSHVFYRQIQILGSTMGSKGDFPEILTWFKRGRLRSVVDRVFALSESRQAFEHLSGRRQFGKVLLNPSNG